MARFYGYDNIPTTLPKGEATTGKLQFHHRVENVAKDIAEFCGFSQGMNYSFESPKVFDKLLIPEDSVLRQAIRISNPLGDDFSIMRTTSLNGMLSSLGYNYSHRNKDVRLYELANIFLQGLETLSLRVERHVENALKVVQYLKNHPQVEEVHHPSVSDDPKQKELYAKYFPNGGGSIFTFEIKGDAQKAKDFIDNLELFSLLANVADVKSLVIHPATTTHSQCTEEELLDQGIKPNTIRLSIGTENIDDIIQDLDEAFKAVQ